MALDEIIAHKRKEVAARKEVRPLEAILRGLAPSVRSLAQALGGEGRSFILECKKASPSKGTIREDYNPVALAIELAAHADAISVLADEHFFGGKLDDVRNVSKMVDIPVLQKDFILEPYQVYEARACGADAILLIMAALDDDACSACMDAAKEMGLDVLVEVHDEAELARALELDAKIIGINSRNLKTLEVDLGTFERLAPLVPTDHICVAESGVKSHADIRRLAGKADAFLIGSSIMESDDVARATRGIVFGRVKVCGLTNPEDAKAAERAGATYGGLIFASESQRAIDMERARKITANSNLAFVGVFVNEDEAVVARIAKDLDLAAVQLHGEETPEYATKLRGLLPEDCEVWKAYRIKDGLPEIDRAYDRVLLDAYAEGSRGGTGKGFDWSILEDRDLSRAIVSGGLNPQSAAEADRLGAFALDVNSGVESAPGKKDEILLKEFFSELRGRGRSGTR